MHIDVANRILYEFSRDVEGRSSSDANFIVKLIMDAGLDRVQAAKVIKIIETTCPHCYIGDQNCKCWNDL